MQSFLEFAFSNPNPTSVFLGGPRFEDRSTHISKKSQSLQGSPNDGSSAQRSRDNYMFRTEHNSGAPTRPRFIERPKLSNLARMGDRGAAANDVVQRHRLVSGRRGQNFDGPPSPYGCWGARRGHSALLRRTHRHGDDYSRHPSPPQFLAHRCHLSSSAGNSRFQV